MTAVVARGQASSLAAGRLPRWSTWVTLLAAMVVSAVVFALINMGSDASDFNVAGMLVVGALLYIVTIYVLSRLSESPRHAIDRFVTALVTSAFIIAIIPLVSLLYTVVSSGIERLDAEYFSSSMRGVVGAGGGAIHAIWGTILITLAATIISVPIGLMTSIYLVEYGGRGRIAKAITFFVDVMTGIPSIVAGLFIFAMFSIFLGPGASIGIMGALSLAVLMIPVVVRSSEELLRIVPNELREAAYALGVPKWRTIVKVVLPTTIAGIMTGIMLSISRVIGETAPLLLTAGFTTSLNMNLFDGRMMTLPVFVYNQYQNQGTNPDEAVARAWAGALTLILIVMALNLAARLIARFFAPKLRG
ncbi:phosphate ABC transporter permease PstA [Agrococcus versicolor]|uniref:Phosphate transport system permease protein PstA n=1 Tax=Agrococcus versicolor TaxID=501482 RepID=A0ABP5MIW6_9MICO